MLVKLKYWSYLYWFSVLMPIALFILFPYYNFLCTIKREDASIIEDLNMWSKSDIQLIA